MIKALNNTKVPKVKIETINEKSYPIINSNFGIKYDNIIKKRTISNIKGLLSIHDPGIFKHNLREIEGIKAFFIGGDNKKEVENNFSTSFSE